MAKSIYNNKGNHIEIYDRNINFFENRAVFNWRLFKYIELEVYPNTTTEVSYRYQKDYIIIGLGLQTDGNFGINQIVAKLSVISLTGAYETEYYDHYNAFIVFIYGETVEGKMNLPTDYDGFKIRGFCFLINSN
jgi:hypothetical protein